MGPGPDAGTRGAVTLDAMSHRIRPVAEKCVDELLGYTLRPPLSTSMLKMVAAARRVALRDLTADQLRLLIVQGEGVTYLVPFALAHLERDPLVGTSYFRGDLLSAVLHAAAFWVSRPEPRERIRAVVERALATLATVRPTDWASGEVPDPDGPTGRDHATLEPSLQAALAQIQQASAGR
jgi:hypothetical protein